MPRYTQGPKTTLNIGEDHAGWLQFLTLIERTVQNNADLTEDEVVEGLIATRWAKVHDVFEDAMRKLNKQEES